MSVRRTTAPVTTSMAWATGSTITSTLRVGATSAAWRPDGVVAGLAVGATDEDGELATAGLLGRADRPVDLERSPAEKSSRHWPHPCPRSPRPACRPPAPVASRRPPNHSSSAMAPAWATDSPADHRRQVHRQGQQGRSAASGSRPSTSSACRNEEALGSLQFSGTSALAAPVVRERQRHGDGDHGEEQRLGGSEAPSRGRAYRLKLTST